VPNYNSDKTVVRNPQSVAMFYDFLGPRGMTIAANTDVAFPGDIFTMWFRSSQKLRSLQYALNNNLIEVLNCPAWVGYDSVTTGVYALGIRNGAPVGVAADYGSYSGSAPTV